MKRQEKTIDDRILFIYFEMKREKLEKLATEKSSPCV